MLKCLNFSCIVVTSSNKNGTIGCNLHGHLGAVVWTLVFGRGRLGNAISHGPLGVAVWAQMFARWRLARPFWRSLLGAGVRHAFLGAGVWHAFLGVGVWHACLGADVLGAYVWSVVVWAQTFGRRRLGAGVLVWPFGQWRLAGLFGRQLIFEYEEALDAKAGEYILHLG